MMGGYIAPGPDYKYKNINKYTENGDCHLSANIRQTNVDPRLPYSFLFPLDETSNNTIHFYLL